MELDGFKDLEQQRQAREDFFEKSFDPTYIEKGKRGGTGEIREWKDGKYQKQSDGTWKPVKEGGGKGGEKKYTNRDLEGYGDYKIQDHKDSIQSHIDDIKSGKDKEHNLKFIEIHKELLKRKTPDFKDAPHHQENLKKYLTEVDNKLESAKLHSEQASKLSDKEHIDEEVGLGSKKEDPKKSEQVEDYDREWVESFMKKVRGAIKGVSLTPSRGDLSRDKKVKKIIRNIDDFPYYEMEVVKRELKNLDLMKMEIEYRE